MQQAALNLLGSASFSAIVLFSASAQAQLSPAAQLTKPAASGYVEFSVSETAEAAQSDCSCQNSQLDAGSDRVGDLAIDQYGCDCAGCRNQVLQMVQAGGLIAQ